MKDFFDENFDNELKDDAPTEHPTCCFVIEIKNNNPITLQNIEVGNACENLHKENYGLPPNVTATCKQVIDKQETELTYEQYLNKTILENFTVGLFFIQSQMGLTIEPTVISEGIKKTFQPLYDPYRQKSTIFPYKYFFTVNGIEQIILSQLDKKSTCKIYLYLSQKINVNSPLSKYANPTVTQKL